MSKQTSRRENPIEQQQQSTDNRHRDRQPSERARTRSTSAVRRIEHALQTNIHSRDPDPPSDSDHQQPIEETINTNTQATNQPRSTTPIVSSSLSSLPRPIEVSRPSSIRSSSPEYVSPERSTNKEKIKKKRTTSKERRQQRRKEKREQLTARLLEQFDKLNVSSGSSSLCSSRASSRDSSIERKQHKQKSKSKSTNKQRTSSSTSKQTTCTTRDSIPTQPTTNSSSRTSASTAKQTQQPSKSGSKPLPAPNSSDNDSSDSEPSSGTDGNISVDSEHESVVPTSHSIFSTNSGAFKAATGTGYSKEERKILNKKKKIEFTKVDFKLSFTNCSIVLKNRNEFKDYRSRLLIYLQTAGARDLITKSTEANWKELSLPYIAANTPIIVYREFRNVCAKLCGLLWSTVASKFTNITSIEQEIKSKYLKRNPNFIDEINAVTNKHTTDFTGSFWENNPYLLFSFIEDRFTSDKQSLAYMSNKVTNFTIDNISNYHSTQQWLDNFNNNRHEVEKIMSLQPPETGHYLNNIMVLSIALSQLTNQKYQHIKRRIHEHNVDKLTLETLTALLFADEHDRFALRNNKVTGIAPPNKQRGGNQQAQAHLANETSGDPTLALITAGTQNYAGGANTNSGGNGKKKSKSSGGRSKRSINNDNLPTSTKPFIAAKTGDSKSSSSSYASIAIEVDYSEDDFSNSSSGGESSSEDSDEPGFDMDSNYEGRAYTAAISQAELEAMKNKTIKMISTNRTGIDLSKVWVLDSGATRHLTCIRDVLEDGTLKKLNPPITITGFSGHNVTAKETGIVNLNPSLELVNVIYTPGTKTNLISQSALVNSGLRFRSHFHEQNNTIHCVTFYEPKSNKFSQRDLITFCLCPQGLWIYKSNHKIDDQFEQQVNVRPRNVKKKVTVEPRTSIAEEIKAANEAKRNAATGTNTSISSSSTASSSTTTSTTAAPHSHTTVNPRPSTRRIQKISKEESMNRALAKQNPFPPAPNIVQAQLALVTVNEQIDTDNDTDDDSTGTQTAIFTARTTNTTSSNIEVSNSTTSSTATKTKTLTAAELHVRYGHVSLSRAALDELGCTDTVYDAATCDTCAAVRIRKKKTGTGTYIDPYAGPLLRLDMDIQGPITDVDELGRIVTVKSLSGAKYILNIICHHTRYMFSIPLVTKASAAQHIINVISFIKTQYGVAVQCAHSDGGGEFCNSRLKDYYAANGIVQSLSPPYSPSTNGTVERSNQTILLMVKSMLHTSNAPSFLWGEAVVQAAKIHNAVPLKSLNFKSPHELVTGKVAHVPATVFGSDCLYKMEQHLLGKLTIAGTRGVVIGKAPNNIGYRIYTGGTVITTTNVKLYNNSFKFMSSVTSGATNTDYYEDFTHTTGTEINNISNSYEFSNELNLINTDDEPVVLNDTDSTVTFPYYSDPIPATEQPSSTVTHSQPTIQPSNITTNEVDNNTVTKNETVQSNVDYTVDDYDEYYDSAVDQSDYEQYYSDSNSDSEEEYKYSGADYYSDENEDTSNNDEYTGTENYTVTRTHTGTLSSCLSPIKEEVDGDNDPNNSFGILSQHEDTTYTSGDESEYESDSNDEYDEDEVDYVPPTTTTTTSGRVSSAPPPFSPFVFSATATGDTTGIVSTGTRTKTKVSTTISNTISGATSGVPIRSSKHSNAATVSFKSNDHSTESTCLPVIGGTDSDDEDFGLASTAIEQDEPNTYRQAMRSRDSNKWSESMKDEFRSIIKNQVLVRWNKAANTRILGTRWVYKIKRDENNKPVRFKSRLVAKGYEQIPELDFGETFSPVAHFDTLRLLLAISTIHDTEIKQVDFKTAFLNATLDEEIFISVPQGLEDECITNHIDPRVHCFKLNRALYGLKQSPRMWYKLLISELLLLGYKQCSSDPCLLYKYVDGCSIPILIGVYVDDMIISVHRDIESVWLADKAAIMSKYEIDDLNDINFCLKMKIERDRVNGTLTISQSAYVHHILSELDIDINSIKTKNNPCSSSNVTDPDTGGTELLDAAGVQKYQQMIGSLMYLCNTTRLDICYTVHMLARYAHAPMSKHMKAALHVIRYIAGTPDVCLIYTRSSTVNGKFPTSGASTVNTGTKNACTSTDQFTAANDFNLSLNSYTDSDWAGSPDTRISTQGNVVLLNNNIISWACKKQKSVSQSSTEAEFIAINLATRQTVWLQTLLNEIYGIHLTSTIFTDNQAAQQWCVSERVKHQRAKHIDISYKYVREIVNTGAVNIKYVPTDRNLADILTKGVTLEVFLNLRKQIMYTGE